MKQLVLDFNSGKRWVKETEEDMIIRVVKRDFESHFGLSYAEFHKKYKTLLETKPERLI